MRVGAQVKPGNPSSWAFTGIPGEMPTCLRYSSPFALVNRWGEKWNRENAERGGHPWHCDTHACPRLAPAHIWMFPLFGFECRDGAVQGEVVGSGSWLGRFAVLQAVTLPQGSRRAQII